MIQVFLAPVSSTRLYNNYKKTVEIGFDVQDFFSFKATSQYQKLFGYDNTSPDEKLEILWNSYLEYIDKAQLGLIPVIENGHNIYSDDEGLHIILHFENVFEWYKDLHPIVLKVLNVANVNRILRSQLIGTNRMY